MLKNRTISVDLVKKDKTHENGSDQEQIGFEDKARIISEIVETSAIKIGIVVGAYVLLDTIRKVAVASVTR